MKFKPGDLVVYNGAKDIFLVTSARMKGHQYERYETYEILGPSGKIEEIDEYYLTGLNRKTFAASTGSFSTRI